MRFLARHRHIVTGVVVVLCIAAFVYLAIKTHNMKEINVDSNTYSGQAMGTAVKKTIYSDDVTKSDTVNSAIDKKLKELDEQLSIRVTGSEISRCNNNYAVDGSYEVSENISSYLQRELTLAQDSEGAFSPCIRPLADLWGIEDGNQTIPTVDLINETLAYTNVSDIEVSKKSVIFHKANMKIDFGAVGKGIACDEIATILEENAIQGAVVSVGGSIAVYGNKGDDKEWHIGIQDPRDKDGEVFGVLDFTGNKMISTSGDYEKYFEMNGKRYHHILDPGTGYPVDNGLISVTIISEDGFLSDALSTTCFVMGLEDGMEFAKKQGVDAIFVTSDKMVYTTDNIKKTFRIMNEDYKIEK